MKIRAWRDYQTNRLNLIFSEKQGDKYAVYNLFSGIAKVLNNNEGCPDDFVMKIPEDMEYEVLQQLSEVASEKGAKPDQQAKIEGTLQATKEHLKDLRHLLKLPL